MKRKNLSKAPRPPKNAAILLAGGRGSRMRGAVPDKVMEPLSGLPVILHSFRAFLESGQVSEIVFVCRDAAQKKAIAAAVEVFFPGVRGRVSVKFARGGAERQDSVLNGLEAVSDKAGFAFIHDGARPLAGAENIVLLAAAAARCGAAVLAARVTDTIKRVPRGGALENIRPDDLDRSRLWAMQTPQVFRASDILEAYRAVKKSGASVTDDVAAYMTGGHKISIVENMSPNPKITVPQDMAYVEFLLEGKA